MLCFAEGRLVVGLFGRIAHIGYTEQRLPETALLRTIGCAAGGVVSTAIRCIFRQ